MQTNELTEVQKLEKEFQEKKQKIEVANYWFEQLGIKPSYVSTIYKKQLLSFTVQTLSEAKKINDFFEPDLINVLIRTAGNNYQTGSPYYIEFKTWSFNGNRETTIHFETLKEYIDIKVPFSLYDKDILTGFSHRYEGTEAELRRYRKQSDTYNSAGLKMADNMQFYAGSTKSYLKEGTDQETINKFKNQIFTGKE